MSTAQTSTDPLDRSRFPADPWRLVECDPDRTDLGVTETLFTVANGYIGMRGNPEEGRHAHEHGTYINGFHETWPIRHAEAAYGFARTGQTLVNAPDAKLMKLYVDDEPLVIGTADLESYERSLDFRDGVLRRSLVWRTPSGKRVKVVSTRMVSMTQRHLVLLTLEVSMLSGDAPVVVSSQLLNRQDGVDEYHGQAAAGTGLADPRKAAAFEGRVLEPRLQMAKDDRMMLGYQCANSRMTVAVAADHVVSTPDPYEVVMSDEPDLTKMVFRVDAREGSTLRIEKTVAYHTSRGLPVRELSDRCRRTLDRAARVDNEHWLAEQRDWFDAFWASADVEVDTGDDTSDAVQQAIRFNLFTLAQASARADGLGVAAKGVSGSGYEGHYFWDTEVYVAPFLTYTRPELARNLMLFRSRMLPAARERAAEMSQRGALFPWRTINGEEASAYYAAGTAQVHIDADVAHALVQYVSATGDEELLVRHGLAILVETARLYADLGFWRSNGERSFHIHGVTGPDEYTTVVNNNLFTNVMARYNLEQAVSWVRWAQEHHADEYARLAHRLKVTEDEVTEWAACAAGMHIPFDEGLQIHPQDDFFLDREVWDLSRTPQSVRPLLLHYHPLVIYRFQVLKQADVVLALHLAGDRFTAEEKRADFEYYDPITTGDSTLSGVVQSVMAAEVGYQDMAMQYFLSGLYVDLADLHSNARDGAHIASTGGVWNALIYGFAGLRDHHGDVCFDPRLPAGWSSLRFPLAIRGSRLRVHLEADAISFEVEEGGAVEVSVRGTAVQVQPGSPVAVALDGQGPRLPSLEGSHPVVGANREDGSVVRAIVPESHHQEVTSSD